MKRYLPLLLIVAVCIVCLILICWYNATIYNEYIFGFYEGTSAFLEQAGLSEFYFLISHSKSSNYICTLFATNTNGDVIENTSFDVKMSKLYFANIFGHSAVYKCTTARTDLIIPSKFNIKVSYRDRSFEIYDEKKVYAVCN